jgi:hypothetical protein
MSALFLTVLSAGMIFEIWAAAADPGSSATIGMD